MQYHQLVLENSEFIASDIALKRIFLIPLDWLLEKNLLLF